MAVDFTKNAAVLTAIRSFATPKQPAEDKRYVVDGYELHAHPDLVDRLKELVNYTSGASLEFAFGIPMLCTVSGRIFAIAGGTYSLRLFLPDGTWGQLYPEYGEPWRSGRARHAGAGRSHTQEDEKHYAALLRLAYLAATKMDVEA
jgi:hypothetical protein